MKKICVVGNFDPKDFGGQTIKTKIISNKLIDKYDISNIKLISINGNLLKKMISVLRFSFSFLYAKNILIFPAHFSLKIFIPIGVIINSIFKRKIHYIVIGGWLPTLIEENRFLLKYLMLVTYIYVETDNMKRKLKLLGFKNVYVMKNCKELSILDKSELVYNIAEPLRLCTFSRVTPKKGIEDIVNAVIKINKSNNKTIYTLDIYGQVETGQEEWFKNIRSNFPSYINYCGIIDYNFTTSILKEYFLLVFPTKYYTEGIPGTIIDAYSAGIPVLAAKWENYNEVVRDNITGFSTEFGNKYLKRDLLKLYKMRKEVNEIKINCLEYASEFTPDKCLPILYKNID